MFSWRGPERCLLCGAAGNLQGCHRLWTNLLCQFKEALPCALRLEPHSKPLQINVFLVSGMFPRLLLGLQIARHDVVLMLCVVRVPAARSITCQEGASPGSGTWCLEAAHRPPWPATGTFIHPPRNLVLGHWCTQNTVFVPCQLWNHTTLPTLAMALLLGLLNVGKLGF